MHMHWIGAVVSLQRVNKNAFYFAVINTVLNHTFVEKTTVRLREKKAFRHILVHYQICKCIKLYRIIELWMQYATENRVCWCNHCLLTMSRMAGMQFPGAQNAFICNITCVCVCVWQYHRWLYNNILIKLTPARKLHAKRLNKWTFDFNYCFTSRIASLHLGLLTSKHVHAKRNEQTEN